MKKIVINGRFLIHRITGVERYAREIIAELDKVIKPGEVEIQLAVPPEAEDVPEYENVKTVRVGKLHNRLWEHISFPVYAAGQKAVSLNLCNVAPLISPGIVCIHDVKIKAAPQYFNRKFLFWYRMLFFNAVKRARAVITVSEFSKKEIAKYYKADIDKIRVISSTWQHYKRIGCDDRAFKKYGLRKREYYFSLCSLEPNKNFKWIAEAAKRNSTKVFAAAGTINENIFRESMGFERPLNMKLLGYVSDEEAKSLMRECKAFLFPTFYEGFGLPPLEAMSAGAECIVVSDTEVMHEVFGDSVNYIDPYAVPEQLEFKICGGGEEVLGKYSWRKSAEKLYQLILALCG